MHPSRHSRHQTHQKKDGGLGALHGRPSLIRLAPPHQPSQTRQQAKERVAARILGKDDQLSPIADQFCRSGVHLFRIAQRATMEPRLELDHAYPHPRAIGR